MLRDFRIAVRSLRSWRWGAVMAVLTLALGIGTTTSLYTMLRMALESSATQIEDVQRLGRVYVSDPATQTARTQVTFGDFESVLSHARAFDSTAAWTRTEMAIASGQDDDTIDVTSVSPGYFAVLRAHARTGRLFTTADFEDTSAVALISEVVWRQRFAARPLADDLTITLNGTVRRVVGVVPAGFDYSFIGIGGDAWIPIAAQGLASAPVSVIVRLKPEHTWTMAAAELLALTPAAQRAQASRWYVIPVGEDSRFRSVSATVGTLLPALIVLIIACVNVACILLARGLDREMELSVRMALGASRGTIFRQLLTENLVLASLGGIAGTAVAAGLVRLIATSTFAAAKPSLAARLSGDFTLLPVALASTVIACLLFGTIPALRLSRRDVSASLKGVVAPSRVRVAGYGARDLVVFAELGVAVVLVVLTAMYFSMFDALRRVTVSFAAEQVIVVPLPPHDLALVRDRVSAVPGVERTAVAAAVPGGPRAFAAQLRTAGGAVLAADLMPVDDAFFGTIGLPIVRGRGFDRAEAAANAAVALISESAARALWPGAEAVGQPVEITSQSGAVRVTVIGVARDTVENPVLGVQPTGDIRSRWAKVATVYRPLEKTPARELGLLVRAANARAVRRVVAAAARPSPTVPIPRAIVLSEQIGHVPEDSVGLIRLFGGFALLALLLAGSGIFGVVNQSVRQRTTELGVRMALGATHGRVLGMVLTREGKLIVAALFAGSVGTTAVTKTLFAELVVISARHPAWPAALITLCGVVAVAACGMATYRIVKLDPWTVLRRSQE